MLNLEGKENFIIRNSVFDIQNRENFQGSDLWLMVSGSRRLRRAQSRRGLPYSPVFICHLTADICLPLSNP
jgi:hypothetical protein